MHTRIAAALFAVASAVALVGAPGPAAGDDKTPAKIKDPKWVFGQGFLVRKGGTPDFNKDTPRVGVEFRVDETHGAFVLVSETGGLAVAPGTAAGADKKADWLFAHDLRVRKAGEAAFTSGAKVFGVEAYKDGTTGRLLYVCETGSIALAPLPASLSTDKGPKFRHGLEPKARRPEEGTFEKAKPIGVEVFTDENTGGLVYVTDTGSISAAPAAPTPAEKGKVKPPKALYGLVLRVRGADEGDFTDKTKKLGVEVFEDANTGGLFYLTETGSIATAPKPGELRDGPAGATWKGAMTLKARKGSEKDFEKAAKYGVEVYQDSKTGHLVYVSQTGAIAVLAK